jgi:hypothetical protein
MVVQAFLMLAEAEAEVLELLELMLLQVFPVMVGLAFHLTFQELQLITVAVEAAVHGELVTED